MKVEPCIKPVPAGEREGDGDALIVHQIPVPAGEREGEGMIADRTSYLQVIEGEGLTADWRHLNLQVKVRRRGRGV